MSDAAAQRQREFSFNDKDFRFISERVAEKTGIVLADHKKDMVYARIARRLRALEMKSFKEYCDFISRPEGATEIADFVNAVTTNLTKFFRESHHFDHLRDEVLAPLVLKPPPGKRVRIWSAGCSSGMEPYSIAMTACDAISGIDSWDFRILATDIDTNMLDRGAKGVYRSSDVEAVPKHLLKRYTARYGERGGGEVQMVDRLRNLIAFKYLNLLDPWPMGGPFDVLFCRNVVIYFNKDTQRVLFDRYADMLKPGGLLYIGHSENLHHVTDRFELLGRTIYQKVK